MSGGIWRSRIPGFVSGREWITSLLAKAYCSNWSGSRIGHRNRSERTDLSLLGKELRFHSSETRLGSCQCISKDSSKSRTRKLQTSSYCSVTSWKRKGKEISSTSHLVRQSINIHFFIRRVSEAIGSSGYITLSFFNKFWYCGHVYMLATFHSDLLWMEMFRRGLWMSNKLVLWTKVFGKIRVPQLAKNIPELGSLPCSQKPATCSSPESHESGSIPLKSLVTAPSHLRLGLPSNIFFQSPPPPKPLPHVPHISSSFTWSSYSIWRGVQVTQFLIMHLSLGPFTFSFLGPNTHLSKLFPNTLSPCSSLNVRHQVFTPIQTDKIIYSSVHLKLCVFIEQTGCL
jgi:hypothetical protein